MLLSLGQHVPRVFQLVAPAHPLLQYFLQLLASVVVVILGVDDRGGRAESIYLAVENGGGVVCTRHHRRLIIRHPCHRRHPIAIRTALPHALRSVHLHVSRYARLRLLLDSQEVLLLVGKRVHH